MDAAVAAVLAALGFLLGVVFLLDVVVLALGVGHGWVISQWIQMDSMQELLLKKKNWLRFS